MKKYLVFLLVILTQSLINAQSNYTLKLKFDEKYFLSNLIPHKTNNSFVLKIFKKTDSISNLKINKNYIVVLDSILRKESQSVSEKELLSLDSKQRKEFDSLKIAINNGDFLNLMKKAVDANFDEVFLKSVLEKEGIQNVEISKPEYNRFVAKFSNQESLQNANTSLTNNSIFFHQSIEDQELGKITDCFMNENKKMVDENYLKKENNYLLIYYESEFIKRPKIESKCFENKKIATLLKKGLDSDVYLKLFFVKESSEIENSISKLIKGFDIEFEKNVKSYNDNKFYITLYLDENGKESLRLFSEQNIGKAIFISNNSQFLLNPKINSVLAKGSILLNGNLFDDNWQDIFDAVKFEVFKNSLTFEN